MLGVVTMLPNEGVLKSYEVFTLKLIRSKLLFCIAIKPRNEYNLCNASSKL